jgi:hypothetical protein
MPTFPQCSHALSWGIESIIDTIASIENDTGRIFKRLDCMEAPGNPLFRLSFRLDMDVREMGRSEHPFSLPPRDSLF